VPGWGYRPAGSEDLALSVLFVINVSAEPCGVGEPGFLAGEYPIDSGFATSVEGATFVGPVEWVGPPDAPAVFIPADPAQGVPIGPDALVTTAGVGAFRAGMTPQELADATGSAFVAVKWGVASPGCGYGWLAPGLGFTFSSSSDSLAAASVGAIERTSLRTPSGIGVGSSAEELRAALGNDRLDPPERVHGRRGLPLHAAKPR
jgi:hypothetical protein